MPLLRDVPQAPAYVCLIVAGADWVDYRWKYGRDMEVWPCESLPMAEAIAKYRQEKADSMGYGDCGHYRAVTKLPPVKIFKIHASLKQTDFAPTGQYIGGKSCN